jgi:mannose-6-phosphate isomerase-like protein (cupin superfamily)
MMEQGQIKGASPSVVPRVDIPISDAPDNDGFEVRPFDAHALLSTVVSRSDVALAWTRAGYGHDVALRSHPTRGLLIVLGGNARLVGRIQRDVVEGDVITLPEHHEYGFRAVGPNGLHALHVAFGGNTVAVAADAMTLEQLLAYNEMRAQRVLSNPFYALLRQDEGLRSARRRSMMREALRVFSDAFQTILFTRQATCRDEHFRDTFHGHFLEELGHNKMLKVPEQSRASADSILRATSAWFCHQMLVLDNGSKAIVSMVLETAGYYFHMLASPVFAEDESADYFHAHAEADEEHKDFCVSLLKDLHPENYRRLHCVLESTWDMFDVMTRRIAHLVELADKSS